MNFLRISFILLAISVVLGAFGAHALKEVLSADSLSAWRTGVEYQFFHALALLILALNGSHEKLNWAYIKVASYLLLIGILLFSGSIYLLTTQSISGIPFSWLGPFTPIGGLCFISGWIACAFAVKRR